MEDPCCCSRRHLSPPPTPTRRTPRRSKRRGGGPSIQTVIERVKAAIKDDELRTVYESTPVAQPATTTTTTIVADLLVLHMHGRIFMHARFAVNVAIAHHVRVAVYPPPHIHTVRVSARHHFTRSYGEPIVVITPDNYREEAASMDFISRFRNLDHEIDKEHLRTRFASSSSLLFVFSRVFLHSRTHMPSSCTVDAELLRLQ